MVQSAHSIPVSPPSQEDMNDEWRQHGEARRKALLDEDESKGGTSFHINPKCQVERYFEVSDRVSQDIALSTAAVHREKLTILLWFLSRLFF